MVTKLLPWGGSLVKIIRSGLFCLLSFAATYAVALVPNNSQKLKPEVPMWLGQKIIRPTVTNTKSIVDEKIGSNLSIRTDAVSGQVRLISGGSFNIDRLDLTSLENSLLNIRTFVDQNVEIFGVDSKDLELNKDSVVFSSDLQLFKFKVYRRGHLIEDAVVDFRFRGGKLLQVVSRTYSEARQPSDFEEKNIKEIAQSYLKSGEHKYLDRHYRIVQNNQSYSMVLVESYEVKYEGEVYLLQVDVASGKVFELRKKNLFVSGTAKAKVYPRDWTEAPVEVNLSNVSITNGTDSVFTGLDGKFDVPEGFVPKLNGFSGKYAEVIIDSGDLAIADGVAHGGIWNINYSSPLTQEPQEDQSIAQPMAYHHVQIVRDFTAGFIDTDWLNEPLPIHTNYQASCNAFWNGTAINLLNAGRDCAHSGLIADVIYHEWGHGLDHMTGGIADVAFSEGFSDSVSMLITKDHILAPNFFLDGQFVRDNEPDKIYPDDRGEVHHEGQIIASTLWDLYKTFRSMYGDDEGTDKLANLILNSIFTATSYKDVYDAFLVIDDNDADLSNGTPHSCLFNVEFAKHGLVEIIDSCRLAKIEDFNIDDSSGNNNGVIEPGENVEIFIAVNNPSNELLTGLKGVLTVPSIEGVELEDIELEWGDIEVGGQGTNILPAILNISTDVACGTNFDLNIRLHQEHRNFVVDRNIEIGDMIGQPIAYEVENLPIGIPDASSKEFVVYIKGPKWPTGMKVYDAHLKFDVTHPYVGDVEVHMTSPMGLKKRLIRGIGRGDNMHYDKNLTQLFKNEVGKGFWSINFTDWSPEDVGTLDALRLTLTPANFKCEP
jgi:hypothetical protein